MGVRKRWLNHQELAHEIGCSITVLRRCKPRLMEFTKVGKSKEHNIPILLFDRKEIPLMYERIFWQEYERQSAMVGNPPLLRDTAVQRVLREHTDPEHSISDICCLGEIPERLLFRWRNGGYANVTRFEQFIMLYGQIDLFDVIDIYEDISMVGYRYDRKRGVA